LYGEYGCTGQRNHNLVLLNDAPDFYPQMSLLERSLLERSLLERSETDLVLPKRNSGSKTREAKLGKRNLGADIKFGWYDYE